MSFSATGEPPLCMSCGVMFALRDAINASRCDAGEPKHWLDISKCIPIILPIILFMYYLSSCLVVITNAGQRILILR